MRPTTTLFIFILFIYISCSKPAVNLEYDKKVEEIKSLVLRKSIPAASIDKNVSSQQLFMLGHCSDIHAENCHWNWNLQEFIDFFNDTSLLRYTNALICTGDICNGFPGRDKKLAIKEINEVNSYFLNQKIPSLIVIGNHDSNIEESGSSNMDYIYNHAFTKEEQFQYIFQPYVDKWGYRNGNKLYYKKVFDANKIVIVVLDFIDYPVEKSESNLGKLKYKCGYIFSQEQLTWFYRTLYEVPPDYAVIVAVHSLPKEELKVGVFEQGTFLLPDIINAYKNGLRYKHEWQHSKYSSLKTCVDFDFRGLGKREFICWLGGHIHTRVITVSDRYVDQWMITAPALFTEKNMTAFGKYSLKRTTDGFSRNSFNIIQIDREKHLIYLTFFGAYENEGKVYDKEIVLDYESGICNWSI